MQTTGSGTATSAQALAGGDPGEYLVVQNQPTPSAGQTIRGWHLNSSFLYDPSIAGAISTIDWRVSVQNLTTGQFAGIGLEQGGSLYFAGGFTTTTLGPGWVDWPEATLTEADFPGADFSASADPITFGLFSANTFDPGEGDVSNDVGYDNLSITVTPVPEPDSAALILLGLSLLGVRRSFATAS